MRKLFYGSDEDYMEFAIELAELGRGYVSPNPLVGAVVVKEGRVVGVGYHRRYGQEHAEVRALKDAGEASEGATLYVTLEPHNFHGLQPPCTQAIIKSGIRRVVIGALDPNPKVRGRGVKELKDKGIEVRVGVLEERVKRQNEIFFTFHEKGRPFVALKIAITADGRIGDEWGSSKWITSDESRRVVHLMRSQYDAILVGAGTVRTDDPHLTVRHTYAERQPLRVVLTRSGNIPPTSNVLSGDPSTLILHTNPLRYPLPKNVDAFPFSGKIEDALSILKGRGVTSVLVEGGRSVFSHFLLSGMFDKVYIFLAPKFLGGNLGILSHPLRIGSPLNLSIESAEKVGEDILITLRPA